MIRECLEQCRRRPGRAGGGRLRRPRQRTLPARPGRRAAPRDPVARHARRAACRGAARRGDNGARLHALCLQAPWPSQTPTLLAWVRRHAPEVYARTGTAFLCKDFVTFRLTGRRVSDISDMSGAGFLRLPDGGYDDGLLDRYGLADARPMLPDLVDPTEIVGGVTAEAAAATGLAEGTPVVGGLFDVVASALGSGVSAPGEASIIAGTWSINQVIAAEAIADPRRLHGLGASPRIGSWRSSRAPPPPPTSNGTSASSSSAAATPTTRSARATAGRRRHPGRRRPLFPSVPLRLAARAPSCAPASTASPAGTARAISCAPSSRASPSSTAATSMCCAAPASASTRAALSGGGARSAVWPQMFADVLGIPITVAACAETGALGAAIAAGVGVGAFPDLAAGVRAMTRPRAAFAPDPAMAPHYGERYRTYGMLTAAMTPLWRRMAGRAARGVQPDGRALRLRHRRRRHRRLRARQPPERGSPQRGCCCSRPADRPAIRGSTSRSATSTAWATRAPTG